MASRAAALRLATAAWTEVSYTSDQSDVESIIAGCEISITEITI
jgi:hypothetical protein